MSQIEYDQKGTLGNWQCQGCTSVINPPEDYNYEIKTRYINQVLQNTGEQ